MNCSEFQNEQQIATQYVSMIKTRFANDNNSTYNRFMAILQEYQTKQKDIKDVMKQVGFKLCS